MDFGESSACPPVSLSPPDSVHLHSRLCFAFAEMQTQLFFGQVPRQTPAEATSSQTRQSALVLVTYDPAPEEWPAAPFSTPLSMSLFRLRLQTIFQRLHISQCDFFQDSVWSRETGRWTQRRSGLWNSKHFSKQEQRLFFPTGSWFPWGSNSICSYDP